MPTENRSSNTDPRDLFISRNPLGLGEKELAKDRTGFADQRTHSDYLTFLAGYEEAQADALRQAGSFAQRHENDQLEQPLGEPAWYMTEGGLSVMHAKAKTMSDQQGLDSSAYSVPLYTHADPAEALNDLEDAKEACAEIERTGMPGEVIRKMNDEIVDLRDALEDLLKGSGSSPGAAKKYAKARAALARKA